MGVELQREDNLHNVQTLHDVKGFSWSRPNLPIQLYCSTLHHRNLAPWKEPLEVSRTHHTTSQLCPFTCTGPSSFYMLSPLLCQVNSNHISKVKQAPNPLDVFYDIIILSPDTDFMTLLSSPRTISLPLCVLHLSDHLSLPCCPIDYFREQPSSCNPSIKQCLAHKWNSIHFCWLVPNPHYVLVTRVCRFTDSQSCWLLRLSSLHSRRMPHSQLFLHFPSTRLGFPFLCLWN